MVFNNRIIGIIAVIGATAIFVATLGFRELPGQTLGPAFFPRLVASAIALVGVAIAVPRPDRPALIWLKWIWTWDAMKPFGTIVAVILWIVAQPTLGFLVSTALVLATVTWGVEGRPLISIGLGVVMSVFFYLVFAIFLGVPLAYGPIEALLDPLAVLLS